MSAQPMRFVSCDWGTSNFRLRLVGVTGTGKGEVRTGEGAARLADAAKAGGDRAELFRMTLRRGLDQLGAPPGLPIVISGMAGSSIGWKELPYARLPFALDGGDVVSEPLEERIILVSGLRSDTDVLRGEETEALGLAEALGSELPARAFFVLPGTHSKHLEIESGRIVSFRTYLTGELFDLLARQSVLRHSTEPAAAFEPLAFIHGVEESQTQPLTTALFRVRTRQLLDRQDKPSNTAFLSGLLIGAELASLRKTDCSVIVAAGEHLRKIYGLAGEALKFGSRLRSVDSDSLAALGQEVLLRRLFSKDQP